MSCSAARGITAIYGEHKRFVKKASGNKGGVVAAMSAGARSKAAGGGYQAGFVMGIGRYRTPDQAKSVALD